MIDILIKKIPESEHGIFGLGAAKITAKFDGIHHLKIEFDKQNMPIEYVGDFAEMLTNKFFRTKEIGIIASIKKIAADSCGTTVDAIMSGRRFDKGVQARYLVFWYVTRKMGYSLSSAGAIFTKDHATALNGIKYIEKDNKYKKKEHVKYHEEFFSKIEN